MRCDDDSFLCRRIECRDDVLSVEHLAVVNTCLEILDIDCVSVTVERLDKPFCTLLMSVGARHSRTEITLFLDKIIR